MLNVYRAIAVSAAISFLLMAAPTGATSASSVEYQSPDGAYSYMTWGAGTASDPYHCEITAFAGKEGTVHIQSALEGYPLRTITSLEGCKSFTLVVPQTVVSIGAGAFSGCMNLKSLLFLGDRPAGNLPENVSVSALQGASGWEEGTARTAIRIHASGGSSFSYYVLDGEAQVLGPVSGTEFSIPSVDSEGNRFAGISAEAFRGHSVKSIAVAEGIREIGVRAFYGCLSLISVKLPDSLRHIRDEAFRYCLSMGNVDLRNVETIGFEAFRDCKSFTSIIIPDSVRRAEGGCFYICTNASCVKVGRGLDRVSERMFGFCTSMESIEFAEKSVSVGDYAFNNCRSMEAIDVSGAEYLGRNAFFGCEKLADIKLSPRLQSIGDQAFAECRSLTSVKISDSLKTLGSQAFFNCICLTDIYFGGPMPKIDSDFLFGTQNVEVHIQCVHKGSWKAYRGNVTVEGDCVDSFAYWTVHLTIFVSVITATLLLYYIRMRHRLAVSS